MHPTKKLLAMPLALLFAGCQTIANVPPANCSEFIPPSWEIDGYGAEAPTDDSASSWMTFGVAQTGEVVKLHGRFMDTIHIYRECEKRANAARPKGLF